MPDVRSGFSSMFRRELKRLGLVGLPYHGLRQTAGARLAEAGATDRELMSVSGQSPASMVSRCTRRLSGMARQSGHCEAPTRASKDQPGSQEIKNRAKGRGKPWQRFLPESR